MRGLIRGALGLWLICGLAGCEYALVAEGSDAGDLDDPPARDGATAEPPPVVRDGGEPPPPVDEDAGRPSNPADAGADGPRDAGSTPPVDVDGDRALKKRYGLRLPVLEVAGEEVFEGRPDAGTLRRAVRAALERAS